MPKGVPFDTGISFLQDLHTAPPTGLNHRILSHRVLFSFPSAYTFFPPKSNPKIFNEKNEPVHIDLFQAEDWIKYKLGIFSVCEPTEQLKTFLQKVLDRAAHFRTLITFDPKIKYPPIATLMSKSHPTMYHILMNGPKSKNGLDFETLPKIEGDGRVTYGASKLPQGRNLVL
jgi:hypothetical protein